MVEQRSPGSATNDPLGAEAIMEQVGSAEYVVATYEEIRLRFGLGGADQARIKAKRHRWPAEPPNHPVSGFLWMPGKPRRPRLIGRAPALPGERSP
jgi:hypothetical protein